jgi:hypothetical protein
MHRKRVLVLVIAALMLGGALWLHGNFSAKTGVVPLGVISPDGEYLTNYDLATRSSPDVVMNAEVKRSWLTGKIEAVKTYRNMTEYASGQSEWLGVRGSKSWFPYIETARGIWALSGVDEGQLPPSNDQVRLVKLDRPERLAQAIRDGQNGDLNAKLLSQKWDTLSAGAKLQVPAGDGTTNTTTLAEDLASLTVTIELTNKTQSNRSIFPAFWVVSNSDILVYPFGILDSRKMGDSTSIDLGPSETRVVKLETGYMFRKNELKQFPPELILEYTHGWEWKAAAP